MTARIGAALFAFWLVACGGAAAESGREPMPDPLDGVEAQRLYEHGVALAHRGDHLRAEQYIRAAIERGYDRGEALPMLIQVCVAASRLSAAVHHAEPYLEEHPDDWALRYVVASLHLGMGQIAQAKEHLERVIRDAPDEPDPWFALGTLHFEHLHDIDRARPYFERYLELAPEGNHADEARSAVEAHHLAPPPEGAEVAPTEDAAAEAVPPAEAPGGAAATPAPIPSPAESEAPQPEAQGGTS